MVFSLKAGAKIYIFFINLQKVREMTKYPEMKS